MLWGASRAAAEAAPVPAKAKLTINAQDNLIQPASSQQMDSLSCVAVGEAHYPVSLFHLRDLAHIHRKKTLIPLK
jgi:hypothetical protein